MRACWMLLICLSAGCSTHPVAGFMDYWFPGRVGTNDVAPYGGVCIPQGPIQPPLPGPPPVILQPPTAPGSPVVPPAAPLPGSPGTIPAPPPPAG